MAGEVKVHRQLLEEPLPPPRLHFVITHWRDETDAASKDTFTGFYCQLNITYPDDARCTKVPVSFVIMRRWSHFLMSHIHWKDG
jgi:hypothetical protein